MKKLYKIQEKLQMFTVTSKDYEFMFFEDIFDDDIRVCYGQKKCVGGFKASVGDTFRNFS